MSSSSAKRAWGTRKRKKVGGRVAEYRRQLMLGVKDLLNEWSENLGEKEVCVVCGDGVPKTILQKHHSARETKVIQWIIPKLKG